jgi:hypothetical protein
MQTMEGWRNTVPTTHPTSVSQIQKLLFGGGKGTSCLLISFSVTFVLVYILLLLVRPSCVVYRKYGSEVPTFHHGTAILWSLVAGSISAGLVYF